MINNESYLIKDSDNELFRIRNSYEYLFITHFKSDGTSETTARLKANFLAEKALDGNLTDSEIVDFKDGNRTNYDKSNLYVRKRTIEDPPTDYRVRPHYLYPDDFLVGDVGVLLSRRTNTVLKPKMGTNGYLECTSTVKGKGVTLRIHIAVAKAFIDNPDNKTQVNHKEPIKTYNSYENLEFVTNKENSDHARMMGLIKTVYGEKVSTSSISDEKRLQIAEFVLSHTQAEAAKVFNVSKHVVRGAIRFKKHLDNYNENDYLDGIKMV